MRLLTVKEAAEALNCSESFVRARLADGSLRHYVLGAGQGGKRVSEEQLLEYLVSREKGGQPRKKPAPTPRPLPLSQNGRLTLD